MIQIDKKQCGGGIFLFCQFVFAEARNTADNQKNQQERNIALENRKALQAEADNIIDVHLVIVVILITDVDVIAFICILRKGERGMLFLRHI